MESEQKEIPLFTKPCELNPDVSHIVREVFQEDIDREFIPKNVERNAEKYKIDSIALNYQKPHNNNCNCCSNCKDCKSFQYQLQEISQLEENILTDQGKILISEVNETDCEKRRKLLKRHTICNRLNSSDVKKYNLIQAHDLLPSLPEQMIDFQLNPLKHSCTACEKFDLELVTTKLGDARYCTHNWRDKKSSEYDSESLSVRRSSRKRKLQRNSGYIQRDAETVLKAIPERITFYNYELNTVYKQTFKIRNISRATRSFVVRPLTLRSPFRVDLETSTTKLAPGISALMKVTFFTKTFNDAVEEVVVCASNGSVVIIQLFSYRNSPILRGFVMQTSSKAYYTMMAMDNFEEETQRHIVVNTTLDCGYCFIGNTNTLNVLLLNEGGPGSFFVISENDWFFCTIDDVSSELVLSSNCFDIYPAYFHLEEGEVLDLEVSFFPTSSGLHLLKVFLLCDNCTYQEIDVIGDGVFYDSEFVEIEAPKKGNIALTYDDEARMIIDFKEAVQGGEISHVISISNNSCMDLTYRWEIRRCSFSHNFGDKKLHTIKKDWIKISPKSHYIPAYSTTDFTLVITTSGKIGTFACVLGFVVTNIPQASLIEGQTFTVYEKEPKSDCIDCPHLLDILVQEIEICFEVREIQINMYPKTIFVSHLSHISNTIIREVTLETNGIRPLRCEWIRENKSARCVVIKPKNFALVPGYPFICEVMITFHKYFDVYETFCLNVNNGAYTEVLTINVMTEKPKVQLKPEFINFGFVRKNSEYSKTLTITNLSDAEIRWCVSVFVYNTVTHETEFRNCMCLLSEKGGVLEARKGSSCELKFNLDTSQLGKYLAFLILTTIHPSQTTTSGLCMIAADITEPHLVICAPNSEYGNLCLEQVLYLGVSSTVTINIQNDSELPAGFVWGKEFFGEQADWLEVTFNPRCGVIGPWLSQDIAVTIVPTTVGIVDELYVPLFVGMLEPPILRIMCVVEGLRVKFHLPIISGELGDYFVWPDDENEGFEIDLEKYLSTAVLEGELEPVVPSGVVITEITEETAQLETALDDTVKDEPRTPTQSMVEFEIAEITGHSSSVAFSGGPRRSLSQTSYHSGAQKFDQWHKHLGMQLLFQQFADADSQDEEELPRKEEVSEEVFRVPTLRDTFEDHPGVTLKNHGVEIGNLKAGEAVKVNIAVENLTPIRGTVEIYSKHFYAAPKKSVLEALVTKIKSGDNDYIDWEDKIHDDYGCVVVIKPNTFTLEEYEYREVEIWIYGNTWGTFIDEIECDIDSNPAFTFNLFFKIHGYPLEYPFAKNAITPGPIIRLGQYSYTSMKVKREIHVRNKSSLPLKVIWHVFLANTEDPDPFNLIVDLFQRSKSSNLNEIRTMITNYYGKEDWDLLKVVPRDTCMAPLSCNPVTLELNPYEFLIRSSKYVINALLVGHVYVDKKYTEDEYCVRTETPEESPLVVKILGEIELPTSDFDLISGEQQFFVYATNVLGDKNETFREVHRMVFRNNAKTFSLVTVCADNPLVIKKIVTQHSTFCAEEPTIIVAQGSYMEVYVECCFPAKTIKEMADWLYEEPSNEPKPFKVNPFSLEAENILKVTAFMTIIHGAVRKQFTGFEILVLFPLLHVDKQFLDFGVVFVGNTSDLIVTVTNKLESATPFRVIVSNPKVLRTNPSTGCLPVGAPNGVPFEITIFFEPSQSGVYMEEIQIVTNLPHFKRTIDVNGVGSHNEKYLERIRE